MKILLVDDELHVLEGLKETIAWEELGFRELYWARNGAEGLRQYREHRPHVLVTDMNMPEMDGIELIRHVRADDADMPIIILTGYDDFTYTQQAIHLGVTRYILKPSLPEEIEREIRNTVEELRHKNKEKQLMNDIRHKYQLSLPALREHFIYRMITSAGMEATYEKLDELGIDTRVMSCGAVIAAKIVTPSGTGDPGKDWPLYRFAAGNIVAEIADSRGNVYVLRHMEDSYFMLAYGSSLEETAAAAKGMSDEVIRAINDYLKLDVCIGIGNPYTDVRKYPLSLKESQEALHACEMESVNQYVLFRDLDAQPREWPRYPVEDIHALGEAVRMLNAAEAAGRWAAIKETMLRGPRTPLAYVQTMCISIFSYLHMQLLESGHGRTEPEPMSGAVEQIYRAGSREELVRWMEDRVRAMLDAPNRQVGAKSYVSAVKSIVEKRYSEKISFAQIARDLNINRNYLSNLFKKESGLSFINYLTNYRIEKAKELLLSKEYMVYEVADMVGYQDPAYFSRMFKNITGLTPLQYIAKHQ